MTRKINFLFPDIDIEYRIVDVIVDIKRKIKIQYLFCFQERIGCI